jgi:PAS domain S-box-containing protein
MKSPVSTWLKLALTLVALLLAGMYIVMAQRSADHAEFARSAHDDLELLATLAGNELQTGQYQNVIELFKAWGGKQSDVVSMRLVSANGARLAEYHQAGPAREPLSIQTEIQYSYQGKAWLYLVKDRAQLDRRLHGLIVQVFLVYFVVAVLLVLLTHFLLRQRQTTINLRKQTHSLNQAHETLSAQLSRLNEAQTARDQLVSILETTTDIVSISDPDGHLVYMNRAGRECTGLTELDELERLIPSLHPSWAAHLILTEGLPGALRDGNWMGETAVLDAKGREIPVSQVISCHRHASGEVAYLSTIMRDISEAKRVEQELRASRADLDVFRRVVDSSSQAIGFADLDARLRYANDALRDWLGLVQDTDLGRYTFRDFYSAEELSRLDTEVLPAVQAQGRWTGEIGLRSLAGAQRQTVQNVFILNDEAGRPMAYANIITDITERKRAELLLQRFQFMVDNAPQEIWLVRVDGRLVYANKAAAANLGYSQDELVGMSVAEIDYDHGEEFAERAQAIRKMTVVPPFETMHQARDGRLIPKEVRASYLSMADEDYLCGFVIDLSERKAAEQALRLRDSGIAMSINAIAYADLEGRLTYVNKAFLEMWGHAAEAEVIGRSVLEFWSEPDLAANAMQSLLRDEKWSGELVARRKNGGTFISLLSATLIRAADGAPIQLMGSFLDITERKRVEDALRASEARLEGAQEIAHLGSWDLDLSTGKARWSKEEYRLLGYAPDSVEASADAFMAAVHEADRARVVAEMQAAIANPGRPYRVEHRVPRADGIDRILLQQGYVEHDPAGKPIHMLGTSLDVTAPRRSERRLVEAQRIARIGSWELDIPRDRLSWSDEIFRIFEIDPARFGASYQAFLAAIHPEDRDFVNESYATSLRDRRPYDITHRLLMPDGRIKYVRERCETVFDDQGKPLRSLGTVQDVTELKQAESQLRRYQEHLEELVAERTRQVGEQARIIDQIHDAVITTDLEGVVTSWNAGAERLSGYAAEEAVGHPIAFVYPPEEQNFLRDQVIRPLLEKGLHETEVRMRAKDGRNLIAHLSLSLLYDESGAPRGMVGYSLDIGARKVAEAELERQRSRLAAANHELEAFAYSVSHDLRAPLRGIDGFSQALLEDYGGQLDGAARDYLNRIRAGAQRMGVLIDDILRLSRVTRAKMEPAWTDLSGMALAILAELAGRDPGRTVQRTVQPGMSVWADPGLMRVLLENLLDNAWKYTAKTPAARIEFNTESLDGETVFVVRDNGAGFDMQYSHKLFGAFQRLHHSGEFKGTGIGLATVQRIVHRHGGRVWAEAEVDKGAVFRFVLGTPPEPS